MIFLSWSKKLSRQLAETTKAFFTKLLGSSDIFWMSDELVAGTHTFTEILKNVKKCKTCIVFLTSENAHNPWINFEVGAFKGKSNADIIPVLFGSDDAYRVLHTTPFEGMQIYTYDRESMYKIFSYVCSEENVQLDSRLNELFETHWQQYDSEIKNLIYHNTSVESSTTLADVRFDFTKLWALSCGEGELLDFNRGFETVDLYKYALSSAQNRLWIFGRKNRKVFDNSFLPCFKQISSKVKEGFSFKCLFFSPDSSETLAASAQKKRDFVGALRSSLNQCLDVLDECEISTDCLRFYNFYRNDAIVVVDNIVFFTPVKYDVDGKPFHLTDSPFFACAAHSGIGKYMINIFQDAWDNSKTFKEINDEV